MSLSHFVRALRGARRVGVDTAPLIYHLENLSPYAELTTYLLTRAAAGGLQIVVSTISVSEILVGPWKSGDAAEAARISAALRAIPGLVVAEITWDAAVSAARVRAQTGLPLPDSIILASSAEVGGQVVVTNDAAWRDQRTPCRALVLEDFV